MCLMLDLLSNIKVLYLYPYGHIKKNIIGKLLKKKQNKTKHVYIINLKLFSVISPFCNHLVNRFVLNAHCIARHYPVHHGYSCGQNRKKKIHAVLKFRV